MDDDEYAKLIRRMNPARVVIDNYSCDDATVIRVDSMNKHGTLLEVVQVIADLNLVIKKAYISSDGSWFMDVFNVTDREGNKVLDEETISEIQKSLESDDCYFPKIRNSVGIVPSKEYTSIELSGKDRPGLLSDICAVLVNRECNVKSAELWTHNTRVAAVVHVTDMSTGQAIEDQRRIATIKQVLCNLLASTSYSDERAAKTDVSVGLTHKERRLHQMMFDDRDYKERGLRLHGHSSRTQVSVTDCPERGYTVAILRSKDRPKLLFDTVCTLTDMQYVVYHGTVITEPEEAYQEYYIRHVDGHPLRSEAERQRVVQCLEAAIERRTAEGLELEVRTDDRAGLLSDITRILREHGLTIRRADISTEDGKVSDTFFVSDTSGNPANAKTIEAIRARIGRSVLRVKQDPFSDENKSSSSDVISSTALLLGNLFNFYRPFESLSLIKL